MIKLIKFAFMVKVSWAEKNYTYLNPKCSPCFLV